MLRRCVLIFVVVLSVSGAGAWGQEFPTIHPDQVAARYGKPDRVDSTEYDSPRPLIVTRLLDYKSERVRFVFFPDAPVGSGPPYTTWKLMGMLDTKTKTTLTAAEVERRMSGRLMKKP